MQTSRVLALVLLASPLVAQDRNCAPCGTDIRYGGVFDVAAGVLHPPTTDAPFPIGAVVYSNNCPTGQYAPLLSGSTVIDDGEIPSTTSPSPNVGFQQSYKITSFEISYCTRELQTASGGPGATVRVRFFEDYDDCQSLAAAGTPIADFTLTGLPASTQVGTLSCWIVTVSLAGGSEFCMRADADGFYDGTQSLDGFGFALSMPNQTGTTLGTVGGFVIAGDLTQPGFCAAGDGTVFKNAGNLGTGLANDDVYYRQGFGAQSTGCQGLLGDPYGAFYLRVTASLGDCSCAPNDADGDGALDCADGCPLDPAKTAPGVCGCGAAETDSDGDGTPNCIDFCPNDPNKIAPGTCGCGVSDVDADGDGLANCLDGCPNDPNKFTPGACGCGVADTDTDGDGVPNCFDGCPNDPLKSAPGDCGCGNPDIDTDGDGAADCIDLCVNDPGKTAPGQCGCGVPDTDTDGDGTANCNDLCPTDPLKVAPGVCGCGASDADVDGDGLAVCVDNCPSEFNPLQEDCDGDLLGDACEIVTTSFDSNADNVPDECQPGVGAAVCFGDGSGANCPCANLGDAGEGCANSSGSGALLYNFGGASVTAHDTALYVIHMPNNKFGLVYMGIGLSGGGNGLPFGDGLRCVTGQTKRFAVQNTGPVGAFTLIDPVSIAPAQLVPGSTWYFQAWFRDKPTSPCLKAINLSNAWRVDFVN
ncbi:MAG: thrombospondin type 3 repeat-containing protein [Planctomycetes bacterium]|nr:thrombospondin type 3 repeat-containing protein [Planctomycetota bacterium]